MPKLRRTREGIILRIVLPIFIAVEAAFQRPVQDFPLDRMHTQKEFRWERVMGLLKVSLKDLGKSVDDVVILFAFKQQTMPHLITHILGRPVYLAELQLGYHGAYHTECFACCACGKKLDSTNVAEHQGEIFCTGCYKRNFATSGVGFGIGAGTLQTP